MATIQMAATMARRDLSGGLKTIGFALVGLCLVGLGLLVAVSQGGSWWGDSKAPYLSVEGGGFLFNYRIAEATYGIVAKVERTIPPGTLIRTSFENPAGGPPIVVEQTARAGLAKLTLQSPPVHGIKAVRAYEIDVSLIDPASGDEIDHLSTSVKSDLDGSVMPDHPLTIGPGYQQPPAR